MDWLNNRAASIYARRAEKVQLNQDQFCSRKLIRLMQLQALLSCICIPSEA